jgi:hypothetical protein
VNFINPAALGVAYNLEDKRLGGQCPGAEFFEQYVQRFDLIILDDMNSKYGIEQDMIQAALDAAVRHHKAIVITCNEETGQVINERLCQSSNVLKNPYAFLYGLENLDGESQRQAWWKESPPPKNKKYKNLLKRFKDLFILDSAARLSLSALLAYEGSSGAGIMVPGDSLTAASLAGSLTAMGLSGVCLAPSYYDENEKWRSPAALDEAKTIVIAVNVDPYSSEYDSLISVAMHAHDHGQKLIVVTEKTATDFFSNCLKNLKVNCENIPRTRARLAVLFREFAEQFT